MLAPGARQTSLAVSGDPEFVMRTAPDPIPYAAEQYTISSPTTGEAAVAVLKGNGYRHNTEPVSGATDTRPDLAKKIICRTLAMVAAMGDAWVMTSFCPFQASLPSDLWKASRHWSGALPWTKIRSPSINGDAALCHAITVLPY